MAKNEHDHLIDVPKKRRLPDFYILGAPKCGTTTLFAWLASHPDTFLPRKEPNFLSPDVVDVRDVPGALTSWDVYLDQLCPASASACITGEATPRYLYSDLALEILARFSEPPRLLILLRNPIDLVFSLHGQMVKQGDDLETDFARAWQRAISRTQSDWYTKKGRCDSKLDYPRFGRFAERIEKVLALFPASKVKIMILEESLGPLPAASYAEVLNFLNLPVVEKPDLSVRNRRDEVGSLRLQGRLSRLRRSASPILSVLGVRKGRGTGIMRVLTQLNRSTKSDLPERPTSEQRHQLAEYFASDVAQLELSLGRKIETWRDFASERHRS